ncbi:unnamed protein product [Cylicocyclus nassatus]|uniref:Uncharacterized protein n=1 Tax=Cylicocyclus nassatus TaxID=53992 RepID=A0AA36DP95_CYLNA|nr:unnamed protein product [Cylicocyclus nassatus]
MDRIDTINGNCSYAETLDIKLNGYLTMGALSVTVIYSIPSTVITYRIVSRMLKCPKSFSSVFYKIFLHDRLVFLLFFVVDVILRVPLTGLLTSLVCKIWPGFYFTILYVLSYYLLYISLYSSIAVSIVRVAVVIIPIDAAKVQLRLALFLLPAIYLLPLVTTWFLFPARSFFAPLDETASLTMAYDRVYPAWRSSLALLFVSIITCVIVLLCFTITIIRWRTLSGRRTLAWNKSEMSLLLTVCSLCLSLCLFCLLQDLMVFGPTWVFYVTHPSFVKKVASGSVIVTVVSAPRAVII